VAYVVLGIEALQLALVATNRAFDLGSRVGVFQFDWSHCEVLLVDRRSAWEKVSHSISPSAGWHRRTFGRVHCSIRTVAGSVAFLNRRLLQLKVSIAAITHAHRLFFKSIPCIAQVMDCVLSMKASVDENDQHLVKVEHPLRPQASIQVHRESIEPHKRRIDTPNRSIRW
jgi:hypothetical protein